MEYSAFRLPARTLAIASLAALLSGCGDPSGGGMQPPGPGALLVTLTPAATAVSNLQLQSASLHFQNLSVFGDVAPNGRSMLGDVSFDLLGDPKSYSFDMIPQGLYSRVRFSVSEIKAQGTWKGHPLQISVETDDAGGALVDLRSPNGVEVQPGQDGTFALTETLSVWFGDNQTLLDQAVLDSNGHLTISDDVNHSIATQISAHVAASFTLDSTVQ
jgi:hypothetical protein